MNWASFSSHPTASADGNKSQSQNKTAPGVFASFLHFAAVFLALLVKKWYVLGLHFSWQLYAGKLLCQRIESHTGMYFIWSSACWWLPAAGSNIRISSQVHQDAVVLPGVNILWQHWFLWTAERNDSKTLIWEVLSGRKVVGFSLSGPYMLRNQLRVKKKETSKQCWLEQGLKRCHCVAITHRSHHQQQENQSRTGAEAWLSHMLDQGQATSHNKSYNKLMRPAKGKCIRQEQIIRGQACKCIPKTRTGAVRMQSFIVKDWADG